jgi:2-polyprenyl-6-methoxyphenol hydroxylase-like FAD-dependent oxidoreductase
MGLEEAVRSKTTKEAGFALVDRNGKRLAEFPVDKKGGMSFIAEVKIVSGELARIFYEASKEGTVYVFGDHVTALRQASHKVSVPFANGPEREFDLVIRADGMRSKIGDLSSLTRSL